MKTKLILFAICETAKAKRGGEAVETAQLKSAPHYFEKTVPQQYIVSQMNFEIDDKKGALFLKSYPPDFLLCEARFDFPDIFSENDIFAFKEKVMSFCRNTLQKNGGKEVDEFSEEYAVYLVSDYTGEAEQFLKTKKEKIVGLLKSEKTGLDSQEIDYTLSSQLKYSEDDLVIADWDGAFIFDSEGDFESNLELFELANLQLLRYRILDRDLDQRIKKVSRLIEKTPV